MKLQSPTGLDICGTLEVVPGVAMIINSEIKPAIEGEFDIEYEGSSEMYWDDSQTKELDGERIFVDSAGGHWPENELRLVEEDLFG